MSRLCVCREWSSAIFAGVAVFFFTTNGCKAQDAPPPAGVAPQQTSVEPSPLTPPLPADKEFAEDPYGWYLAQKEKLNRETGTTYMFQLNLVGHELLAGPTPGYLRVVDRYEFDIHQMLWQGAEADLYLRGGAGDGIDKDLGTTLNTDQYDETGSYLFILHFWLQQKLWQDQIIIHAGKLDMGDFMDTNRYAFYNFIGYSLAHNPVIPLPGNPLGGWSPISRSGCRTGTFRWARRTRIRRRTCWDSARRFRRGRNFSHLLRWG